MKYKILFITDNNFLTKEYIDNMEFFWLYLKSLFDKSFKEQDLNLIFNVTYFNQEKKIQIMNYIALETTKKDYILSAFPFGENKKYFLICKKENKIFFKKNNNEFINFVNEKFEEINLLNLKNSFNEKQLDNKIQNITRILMPKIKISEINDITENSAKISINEINIKNIFKKNLKNNIQFQINLELIENKKFDELYFEKIEYNLILYNIPNSTFEIISLYNIENNKIIFKLSNLINFTLYSYEIFVKYNNYYSPVSDSVQFYTLPSNKNLSSIYFYGINNLIDSDDYSFSKFEKLNENYLNVSYLNNQLFLINEKGKVEILTFKNQKINFPYINNKKKINSKKKEKEEFKILKIPFENIFIKKISIGNNFIIALNNLGECFSLGENKYGELGLGLNLNIKIEKFEKINFNEKNIFINDISSCEHNTIAYGYKNKKNYLFFWGLSIHDNCKHDINSPIIIKFDYDQNIIKLSSKYNTHGIICYDEENNINLLFLLGLFQISNFNNNNNCNLIKEFDFPYLVSFFKFNKISIIDIKFDLYYSVVVGFNINSNKKEIFLLGSVNFLNQEFMTYTKFDKEYVNDIIDVLPNFDSIYFLLKDFKLMIVYENEECLNIFQDSKKNENFYLKKYNDAEIKGDDMRIIINIKNNSEIN